jgi:hypothetical protein
MFLCNTHTVNGEVQTGNHFYFVLIEITRETRYKKRNNNRAGCWLGELNVLVLPKWSQVPISGIYNAQDEYNVATVRTLSESTAPLDVRPYDKLLVFPNQNTDCK